MSKREFLMVWAVLFPMEYAPILSLLHTLF